MQDVLRGDLSERVYDMMTSEQGHIYVCGDVSMASGVRDALEAVIAEQGMPNASDFVQRLMVSLLQNGFEV